VKCLALRVRAVLEGLHGCARVHRDVPEPHRRQEGCGEHLADGLIRRARRAPAIRDRIAKGPYVPRPDAGERQVRALSQMQEEIRNHLPVFLETPLGHRTALSGKPLRQPRPARMEMQRLPGRVLDDLRNDRPRLSFGEHPLSPHEGEPLPLLRNADRVSLRTLFRRTLAAKIVRAAKGRIPERELGIWKTLAIWSSNKTLTTQDRPALFLSV